MNANAQPRKTRNQSQEILGGCHSLVAGFCETQSDAFISEATQELFERADRVKDNNEQRRLFEARQYLEKHASDLSGFLESSVKQRFLEIFSNTRSTPAKSKFTTESEQELSLVNTDEMEIDIAINSMSSRVDNNCAEELFGIAQRMAMLNKGVKLEKEQAPYSAHFFCREFFRFIADAKQEQAIQLLLLKLFERNFLAKLADLYQEMNRYLISSNVLPNLRYTRANKSGRPPRRRSTDKLLAESEQRQAELYQAIESVLAGAPAPIDPTRPMLSTEQVLYDLLMLQKSPAGNLLEQRSVQTMPNTNAVSLQKALECVSLLFELVSNENSLGTPVKNLLSHLQTPYARMALSDPTFLADPQHDARQLMQALVHASEQWTDEDTDSANEVVQRIKNVVERIIADVNDVQQLDSGMFSELLDEFTQFINAFEKKIKLTEQRSVQAAEGREKLRENQQKVDALIEQKIGRETLPKPIEELIRDVWSSYMTYILLRHGENSERWDSAVSAIDSLLWYIEPKVTSEETGKAREIKEALDVILTEGMTNVGLDSADIKQRLHSLDLCLKLATENAEQADTQKARSASGLFDETSVNDSTDNDNADNDNTGNSANSDAASNIIENLLDGQSLDTGQAATQTESKRPSKSRIQQQQEALSKRNEISDLEKSMTDLSGETTRRASKFDLERVLSMKFGTWLSWCKAGEKPRQVKLTWYNSRTQNCMLSNRAGRELGMVSANTIAIGMADGWIVEIDKSAKTPLFERMLEAITGRSRQ